MSLTVKEILDNIKEEYVSQSKWTGNWNCDIDDSDRFRVIEQESWSQNHKSQHRESIYYDVENEVYISVNETRYGNYHDGWESFDIPDISVVTLEEKEMTKIVRIWNTVPLSAVPEPQAQP